MSFQFKKKTLVQTGSQFNFNIIYYASRQESSIDRMAHPYAY